MVVNISRSEELNISECRNIIAEAFVISHMTTPDLNGNADIQGIRRTMLQILEKEDFIFGVFEPVRCTNENIHCEFEESLTILKTDKWIEYMTGHGDYWILEYRLRGLSYCEYIRVNQYWFNPPSSPSHIHTGHKVTYDVVDPEEFQKYRN